MEPYRRNQVSDIYHGALQRPVEYRSAYLIEACGGDENLRQEVESLLRFESASLQFLERPAAGIAGALASAPVGKAMLGQQLGPYRIVAPLGAGGMGEVYRAHDSKLGRDVAIKVLPTLFLSDSARRNRFEREARLLASLTHPHIGAIFGLEEINGSQFLILEFIAGESLARRLAAGPLPVTTALDLGRQVAEALEAAHEKGIVHRDVKPANIMLTDDDQVKVLDFGLAALEPTDTSEINAPTVTFAATHAGAILGTAAYMSPEQAQGRQADKRSDVWAFGCVLYEMLTGRSPFVADNVSDTLATVLRDQPDWSLLPTAVPSAVRTLMCRCLEKERRARPPDMGVVRFILGNLTDGGASAAASRFSRRVMTIGAAVTVSGLTVAGVLGWTMGRGPVASDAPVHFPVWPTPPQTLESSDNTRPLAISTDGRHIVFLGHASSNAPVQLILKSFDQPESTPIAGTEGARNPFLSPDGEWIGYWSVDAIWKKVARTGGPSLVMGTVAGAPRGATWLPDNSIVVGTGDPQSGLIRIPKDGGAPTVLTTPGPGELDHVYPSVLPGGVGVLFTVLADGPRENMQVAVLDLTNGSTKVLLRGGGAAEYVNSGHLVYAVSGTLRAVQFDLRRLEVRGDPATVMDPALTTSASAGAFATSENGTLAYVRGIGGETAKRILVWVDQGGREEPLAATAHAYAHPRLSPDGTRVAVSSRDQERDIWIWDLSRRTLDKLTSGTSSELNPVWTLDSRQVIFASSRGGRGANIFRQRADTTGTPESLTTGLNFFYPISLNADGTSVALVATAASGIQHLAVLHLDGKRPIEPLFDGTSREINGEISPNGRWLAYQSNETGRDEIYVRPFPDVTSRRGLTISSNGGTKPLWAKSDQELFFIDTAGYLMSVRVQTAAEFAAGIPTRVFDKRYFSDELGRTYDVSSDGKRFLMLKDADERTSSSGPTMIVVLNWFDELRKFFSARHR